MLDPDAAHSSLSSSAFSSFVSLLLLLLLLLLELLSLLIDLDLDLDLDLPKLRGQLYKALGSIWIVVVFPSRRIKFRRVLFSVHSVHHHTTHGSDCRVKYNQNSAFKKSSPMDKRSFFTCDANNALIRYPVLGIILILDSMLLNKSIQGLSNGLEITLWYNPMKRVYLPGAATRLGT